MSRSFAKNFVECPADDEKIFLKKIFADVPLDELLAAGDVQVENSSFAWKILSNGIDIMAYRLCERIFLRYQDEGELPERCGWEV